MDYNVFLIWEKRARGRWSYWLLCWRGALALLRWIHRSMSVSTRTPRGRSATALLGARSILLRRRPTVICGWARNSVCFVSTAFGLFPGSRQPVSIFPAALFEGFSLRAMGLFGLALTKD